MVKLELEELYRRERARQLESERQAAIHKAKDIDWSQVNWERLSEALSQQARIPVNQPIVTQPEDPDAQWRRVILPPAIVLILGKRGSGKSALAYRLLELFRYQLCPYVVGVPSKANSLLPEWMGTCPSLEDLPDDSIALVDSTQTLS